MIKGIPKEIFLAVSGRKQEAVYNQFNAAVKELKIKNVFHFFAQACYESGGFRYSVENLNYSQARLLRIFKKYFSSTKAKAYARKPKKIGNLVYANRMGNGNERSGDGYRYRGRGYIQLTGKNNYIDINKYLNERQIIKLKLNDFVKYCESDKGAMIISAAWWKKNGLDEMDDIKKITRKVNGGYNGLSKRIEIYNELINKCVHYYSIRNEMPSHNEYLKSFQVQKKNPKNGVNWLYALWQILKSFLLRKNR